MNIGIDIRCLIEGKRTGVEEYTKELLEHLFVEGKEHHFTLFWNAWRLPLCPFDWETRFSNVRLVSFRIPNKVLNLLLWYLKWPLLDRLIGGVDVFFVTNFNFVSFSRQVPVVLTAHDLSFEICPETFSWKRRLWHMFVNFRSLVARADAVISVSESTRDDLVSYISRSKEKIRVIRSGVATRFQPISRNDTELFRVKERYKLPYHFILFLGTIEPRKNVESIVRAFDMLVARGEAADYDLVLAGTNGWKCKDILEEIESLPSRSRIHRIGFVHDEDKPALYSLADVFTYPSFYEGFGFPPLESIACGTPVITANTSSFPEIVGDTAILVDPLRPDELLRALREIIRDRALAETLSKQGIERAKHFCWTRTARKTLKVFEEVAKSKA